MKQVIIVIILAVTLLSSSFYSSVYLAESSQMISTHAKSIQTFVHINDWTNANKELQSVEQSWHDIKDKWSMLIDHREIDYIEQSLARLTKYVESKNVSDILAESENLFTLVGHIPEIEYISFKNVF